MANAEDIENRCMGFCWSSGWFRIARFGQLCNPDEERREHKNPRDDEVGHPNSAGFANTICGYLLSRHRGKLGWSVARIGENKRSTEKRGGDGADGGGRMGEDEGGARGFRGGRGGGGRVWKGLREKIA